VNTPANGAHVPAILLFARLRLADEEPVLLANYGEANGVFHQVVVDLDAAVFE